MESPFDVLRLDPAASDEEIEQAYKRRVKEVHPDHGGSAAEFRLVRAAYEELTADRRGERSDRSGGEWSDRRGDVDPQEVTRARVEYLDYEVLADYGWELTDDDLFEKAGAADLGPDVHGRVLVEPHETLLEAAENRGLEWPFACRGGACANCAVAVVEGELSVPVNHILPSEMIDREIRLSCVGSPITDDARIVFNLKHLPELDELRLPPRPFEEARADD